MRLLDIIKSSADYLEESGVPDALVDAELLVAACCRHGETPGIHRQSGDRQKFTV